MLKLFGGLLKASAHRTSICGRPDKPRILLIRPDHLGDVLLTLPAVGALRKALPEAHLTMMVGPWSKEIVERDYILDELQTCPFPGFVRAHAGSLLAAYGTLWETSKRVRRGSYDAALVLRYDHWWGAFMAALAGIPLLVGCEVPECSPFINYPVAMAGRIHWARQALVIVEKLLSIWGADPLEALEPLPLRFPIAVEERQEADRIWSQLRLDGRPIVAIHPGAGSPLKLWPEGRWISLGQALVKKGFSVIVTGSKAEVALTERIANGIIGAISIAGQTGIGVLAAVFQRCKLVAGVDSGPLHLAVAVRTPTVHLFGPADSAIYGPLGDIERHRTVVADLVRPCGRLEVVPPQGMYAPCMDGISVERVVAECELAMSDH